MTENAKGNWIPPFPRMLLTRTRILVLVIVTLAASSGWLGYVVATPAPSRSLTIEPGFSNDCTQYIFVDGTTPVAHPGNGQPNVVGTAGQDFGGFINQFLGTAGLYCIEAGTSPSFATTWAITASNVKILSDRGNVFTYTGTGIAIKVSAGASAINNVNLEDIEIGATGAANVALDLEGSTNAIITHFQDGFGAGTFTYSLWERGITATASIFNLCLDCITSFTTFIGQGTASTTANFNMFYDTRFTGQLLIGNSTAGDAPSGNAIFGGVIQTLPISGTVIPLINQGTGTGLYNIDCEQNNKCMQNGVVGDASLAQARVNIVGGYWSGTGGNDGQGFGIVETASAGIVSIKNMRGTTMSLGIPLPSSVTAGTSPWTYTEAGAVPDALVLNNLNGGTISSWTCGGQSITATVNDLCILNPNQSMVVTWATTAPSFIKEPFIG